LWLKGFVTTKVASVEPSVGYPWTDEMIAVAWKHENVHIDTLAYLRRDYPPQLLHFLESDGRDKVLFGANCPSSRGTPASTR
jgi:predicted TIM-barrel fold metal-dependent hydrolase